MANESWDFFNLKVIENQIKNVTSAISKEELEKNFIKVVEELEGFKNNAFFGLGDEPNKIKDAGSASA